MYNRYLRNDDNSYTRVPSEPAAPSSLRNSRAENHGQNFSERPQRNREESIPPRYHSPPPQEKSPEMQVKAERDGFVEKFLKKFQSLDSGDLLLLALLFFLYREKADEELLIALALLLIL